MVPHYLGSWEGIGLSGGQARLPLHIGTGMEVRGEDERMKS